MKTALGLKARFIAASEARKLNGPSAPMLHRVRTMGPFATMARGRAIAAAESTLEIP